jgi:hypothetical protein
MSSSPSLNEEAQTLLSCNSQHLKTTLKTHLNPWKNISSFNVGARRSKNNPKFGAAGQRTVDPATHQPPPTPLLGMPSQSPSLSQK